MWGKKERKKKCIVSSASWLTKSRRGQRIEYWKRNSEAGCSIPSLVSDSSQQSSPDIPQKNSTCCLKAFHSPTRSALSQLNLGLLDAVSILLFIYVLIWLHLGSLHQDASRLKHIPFLTPCYIFMWANISARNSHVGRHVLFSNRHPYSSSSISITWVLYIYIWRMYLWWSLCTLYIEDVPLLEFMYRVYWGCTCGGVYVCCTYSHARCDLP